MSVPTFSVANAYLEESSDLIRSRSVPWEVNSILQSLSAIIICNSFSFNLSKGYQRASLITDKDLEQVRRYDEEMQHKKDTILKTVKLPIMVFPFMY
jgi:hypothetical protein